MVATTDAALADRLARLSPAKRALLERALIERAGPPTDATTPITRRPGGATPLSFAQRRMWFLDQLEPENTGFNVARATRLKGSLDVDALQGALAAIVERHEALRTVIDTVDGVPVATVLDRRLDVPLVDLSDLSPVGRDAELGRVLRDHADRPFDLARDLMMRATLVRLGSQDHLLVSCTHHIASDAWSAGIFERELTALYSAFASNRPSPLPPPAIQYGDFAAWQQARSVDPAVEAQLGYWRAQLDDFSGPLDLPTDRPRPSRPSGAGAECALRLPADLRSAVEELSRREGVTSFVTLLAAFDILLYRYTGQTDLVVGSPVAGRLRPETENVIGLFLNPLALRCDLAGEPSFRDLLARVRASVVGALAHQEVPFDRVVEELRVERDAVRTPLFQVMFIMQSGSRPPLALPGLAIARWPIERRAATYDLTLTISPEADGLLLQLDYSRDLWDEATAQGMLAHLRTLVEGAVANPERSIATLPLLSSGEREQIVHEWNETAIEYPLDRSLAQLFEDQVERTPGSVAFRDSTRVLTFEELSRRANQLAHLLRARGVGPEVGVGLCLPRSLEAVVAFYAILKSGGGYVPIDPSLPRPRLAAVIEDARPHVVISTDELVSLLQAAGAREIIRLDGDAADIGARPHDNPAATTKPEHLAYMLFTSGSTGRPKGVAVEHRQILNRLGWMWSTYPFAPDEVGVVKTPLHFVDSLWELLGCPLRGIPSLVLSDEDVQDPARTVALLAKHCVTRLWFVPSLLRLLLDLQPDLGERLPRLWMWVSSGEALPTELFERFRRAVPHGQLYNLYGTSEVWDATWWAPPSNPGTLWRVPIGRPIANVRTYILDPHLHPVPIGVPGELHVGGDGLARGYVGRADLTAECFIPDPFGPPGARLYRTGDLARYKADGNLELLGRRDHQVKVRGHRVEPDEIAWQLNRHPMVRQSVVVPRPGTSGEQRLVAYVVGRDGVRPTVAALREHLAELLPAPMVPDVFVPLESLPLTPSGKVNRLALPDPDPTTGTDAAGAEATSALERDLLDIWQHTLGCGPIGPNDDFFAMGGHSLLAVRLVVEVERRLGTKLPVASLFRARTVRAMAGVLRAPQATRAWTPLVAIQPRGSRPPFFCVHGLGGGVMRFDRLAAHLGEDQPFYGLQEVGFDGETPTPETVEALAAHHVAAMRAVQATGPYHLGGYCFGAVVAFEMARQLRAAGEVVGLLAVVEGYAPRLEGVTPHRFSVRSVVNTLRSLPAWYQVHGREEVFARGPAEVLRRLARQVRLARRRFDVVDFVPEARGLPPAYQCVMESNLRAARAYRPGVYDGPITLFRSRAPSISHSFDDTLGWRFLTPAGVDTRVVSGAHHTVVDEPHVADLAAQLARCLARAWPRAAP